MQVRMVLGILMLLDFASVAQAEFLFPQLAVGGGYECVLIITNVDSSNSHNANIYIFPDKNSYFREWTINGSPIGPSTPYLGEVVVSVKPRETKKYVISGGDATGTGFLSVGGMSDTSYLAVSYFYNYYLNGKLINSTGGGPALPGYEITFPVERGVSVDTGFAWSSGSNGFGWSIVVTMSLYDSSGNLIQKKDVPLQASSAQAPVHKALFFDELFDANIPKEFLGSVVIESKIPYYWLYVTVLRIQQNPDGTFLLTSVPPNVKVPGS